MLSKHDSLSGLQSLNAMMMTMPPTTMKRMTMNDDIDDDDDYGGGGGGDDDDDDDYEEEEEEHDDVARFGATFVFAFGAVWASMRLWPHRTTLVDYVQIVVTLGILPKKTSKNVEDSVGHSCDSRCVYVFPRTRCNKIVFEHPFETLETPNKLRQTCRKRGNFQSHVCLFFPRPFHIVWENLK